MNIQNIICGPLAEDAQKSVCKDGVVTTMVAGRVSHQVPVEAQVGEGGSAAILR